MTKTVLYQHTSGAGGSTNEAPVFTDAANTITAAKNAQSLIPFYGEATVTDGGTISYQWYRCESSVPTVSNGIMIAGATEATYTPPSSTVSGTDYYYVIATSTKGGQVQQKAQGGYTFVVNVDTPQFIYYSSRLTAYTGNAPGSNFDGTATVDSGTVTYQWYTTDEDPTPINGTPIAGATSATYTPAARTISGTYYYYVVATNRKGENTASATHSGFTLKVDGNAYTITGTAGANGSISPDTEQTVAEGSDITFTFTPDTDYEVNEVTIDGAPVIVTGNSYTFGNVTAAHTINVTFKKTEEQKPTPTPDATKTPEATPTPTPDATKTPEATPTLTPDATKTPEATPTPTPDATKTPDATPTPVVTPAPVAPPVPVNPIPAPVAEPTYNLVVNYGSGDGRYEAGTWIVIEAEASNGLTFSHWISNEVTFDNKDASTTWFIMNSKDVTVTAVYLDAHGNQQTSASGSSPKTGDNSPVTPCLMVVALSLGGLGFTIYKRKEREE